MGLRQGTIPQPGNVRELKNAIVRAACLAQGGEMTVQDLPENIRPKACTRPAPRPTLDEMEQQAIISAPLIRKLKTYKSPAPRPSRMCPDHERSGAAL
jgi:transcriptional regulator of acetoin/glycerol metabolism